MRFCSVGRRHALLSRFANGFLFNPGLVLSWNRTREYRLHEFAFATAREGKGSKGIAALARVHTWFILLSDGSITLARIKRGNTVTTGQRWPRY